MPRAGRDLDVLAVVAVGGAAGATARWGIDVAWPQQGPTGFPWGTLTVNVSGCLLIGLVTWFLVEVWPPHRLVRPFLAVGVLGGYTTFSTFAAQVYGQLDGAAAPTAAGYVVATLVAGVVAVRLGLLCGRLLAGPRGSS
ncbi:MAG: CrcB family protein [Actinomycetota bacterium]|nr:MAG: CrcB family protein [Actinomycetota bacterium]